MPRFRGPETPIVSSRTANESCWPGALTGRVWTCCRPRCSHRAVGDPEAPVGRGTPGRGTRLTRWAIGWQRTCCRPGALTGRSVIRKHRGAGERRVGGPGLHGGRLVGNGHVVGPGALTGRLVIRTHQCNVRASRRSAPFSEMSAEVGRGLAGWLPFPPLRQRGGG